MAAVSSCAYVMSADVWLASISIEKCVFLRAENAIFPALRAAVPHGFLEKKVLIFVMTAPVLRFKGNLAQSCRGTGTTHFA